MESPKVLVIELCLGGRWGVAGAEQLPHMETSSSTAFGSIVIYSVVWYLMSLWLLFG